MKNQEQASIFIQCLNEEKWTGHCLIKVFQQEYASGFEVIVVDNNSTDFDESWPGKVLNI